MAERKNIDPNLNPILDAIDEAIGSLDSELTTIRHRLDALEAGGVDTLPVIQDQAIVVPEDAAIGTVVGTVVAARAAAFAIVSGNEADVFDLDPDDGTLTLLQALDFEAVPAYALLVKVSNAFGEATAAVNIPVTDVDETDPPVDPPVVGDKTYAIGPGMPYTSFAALPDPIEPGATLLVHYKATPYKEKFAVNEDDITIEGVLGPNGERPIIDGNGAKASQKNIISAHGGGGQVWQQRGLFTSGRFAKPWPWRPSNLAIRNLHFRGANGGTEFVSEEGQIMPYWDSAGGVYLQGTNGVMLQNVVSEDCGHGVFGASGGDLDLATLLNDVLLEDCLFYGNGNVGNASFQSHNTYLEALRITYRRCHYGSSRPGSGGGMLKDRSGFTVIEDVTGEGVAGRMLDLVEPENGRPVIANHPGWDETIVRRTTLRCPANGAWAPIAFGGDFGVPEWIRTLLRLEDVTIELTSSKAAMYWRPLIRSQFGIAPRIECRKVRITRTLAPGATQLPEFRLLESPNATMAFFGGGDESHLIPTGYVDGGIVEGREHLVTT